MPPAHGAAAPPRGGTGWQAPRRTTPGGQAWYSDVAIELVPTLRLVFHLGLRQAEGFTAALDFLPAVNGLMDGRERGCLAGWTEPSRPLEHSAVLAPSRTLRAGAERRGRGAASWTALARGALPIGRSGRKDVGFIRTEGWGLGHAAAGLP